MPAAVNPSKLSKHAHSKMNKEEYQAWLRCKRELARLQRGMEELSDLQRKYGKHKDFEIAGKSQELEVVAAQKELSQFEADLELKYQQKGSAA